MISLWFLLLMIFTQTYIILITQTMLFDRTIQVLQMQEMQGEKLARSFFLHLCEILSNKENLEKCLGVNFELKVQYEKKEVRNCYATVSLGEDKKNATITIRCVKQEGKGADYQGKVILQEDGFSVVSFKRTDS